MNNMRYKKNNKSHENRIIKKSPHKIKERAFFMRFWELGNKDVINCKNGHRLGCNPSGSR